MLGHSRILHLEASVGFDVKNRGHWVGIGEFAAGDGHVCSLQDLHLVLHAGTAAAMRATPDTGIDGYVLPPKFEIVLVVFGDRAEKHRRIRFEIVSTIGIAGRHGVLEADPIGSFLGSKPVAVPIFVQGILAVPHADTAKKNVVNGSLQGYALGEIVTVLPLAVADDILQRHVMRIVLEPDGPLREASHLDITNRQSIDGCGNRLASSIVFEEAADIRGVDVLDSKVADIAGDVEAPVALIAEGQVLETEMVRTPPEPKHGGSGRAVGPVGISAGADERRVHGPPGAVYSHDDDRPVWFAADLHVDLPGYRVVAHIGAYQHFPARPGPADQHGQVHQA